MKKKKKNTIACFGETEKGFFHAGYYIQKLSDLFIQLGNPLPGRNGLLYAIRCLLFDYDLLFFRVRKEGFSIEDYLIGLRCIQSQKIGKKLAGIALPGVGDRRIVNPALHLCHEQQTILLSREDDLYDYCTDAGSMTL